MGSWGVGVWDSLVLFVGTVPAYRRSPRGCIASCVLAVWSERSSSVSRRDPSSSLCAAESEPEGAVPPALAPVAFLAGLVYDLGTLRGQVLATLAVAGPGGPMQDLQSSVRQLTAALDSAAIANKDLQATVAVLRQEQERQREVTASLKRERAVLEQEYASVTEALTDARKDALQLQVSRDAAMSAAMAATSALSGSPGGGAGGSPHGQPAHRPTTTPSSQPGHQGQGQGTMDDSGSVGSGAGEDREQRERSSGGGRTRGPQLPARLPPPLPLPGQRSGPVGPQSSGYRRHRVPSPHRDHVASDDEDGYADHRDSSGGDGAGPGTRARAPDGAVHRRGGASSTWTPAPSGSPATQPTARARDRGSVASSRRGAASDASEDAGRSQLGARSRGGGDDDGGSFDDGSESQYTAERHERAVYDGRQRGGVPVTRGRAGAVGRAGLPG